MEEIYRAGFGERARSWGALPRHTILPEFLGVQQPSSPAPCLFGFLWRLHYLGMINQTIGHWWLIQSPTLYSWLVPLAINPHPLVLSKSHLSNIKKRNLYHWGNSKGFGKSVPEMGWIPNISYKLQYRIMFWIFF